MIALVGEVDLWNVARYCIAVLMVAGTACVGAFLIALTLAMIGGRRKDGER